MLYTSYFAKIKDLPKDVVVVGICLKPPKGFVGVNYKPLAPLWYFFSKWKETQDNDYYIECYNKEVLGKLSIEQVLNDIYRLTGQRDNICFVCYEKPNDFCHRHLFSKWLNEHGYVCVEYNYENNKITNKKGIKKDLENKDAIIEKDKYEQLTLFD